MRTKEKIIETIQKIDNESILENLLEMIEFELNLVGDTVKLNDEQKSAIDEGLKDLEEGKYFSNDDAQKIFDEWMKKK